MGRFPIASLTRVGFSRKPTPGTDALAGGREGQAAALGRGSGQRGWPCGCDPRLPRSSDVRCLEKMCPWWGRLSAPVPSPGSSLLTVLPADGASSSVKGARGHITSYLH